MNRRVEKIEREGCSAELQEVGPDEFRFIFQGTRKVLARSHDGELLMHSSLLSPLDEAERDRLLDLWWDLGQRIGLRVINVEARSGDPFETYPVRPK
jgi:hypothetical protein